MVNPFGYTGALRSGLFNQQGQQPYNFSGWDDRLNKIEKGIAGLTEQFGNFQAPGEVEPEYQGNVAPEPLESTPSTGIESLAAEPTPPVAPMGGQAQTQSMSFTGQSQPGSSLGRYMTISPGHPDFNPLTEEQFAGQKDLWGQRQDYRDFSSMASDVTGIGGGIGGLRRKLGGSDPRFGHAYESWQDYAAGYGGSDPSQGMENWMQDYNFDLAPERPQFQPGQGPGGFQSGMADYTQSIQEYENSPEYLEWQKRQEARGPLSASTTQAIGLQPYDAAPDINPYISMSMGGGQDPTYENYLSNIERLKTERENYVPQSTTTSPGYNPLSQGLGAYQRLGFKSDMIGAGGPKISSQPIQPALGGPVQNQIKQGLGSLSQGAGV